MAGDKTLFNESFSVREAAQQKRKKARAQVNIPAEILLDGGTANQPATLTDLGTGGLSLQCRTTLYPGDKLKVLFKLKGTAMSLPGSVARVSGKSIGVQFTSISDEQMESIQSFIHSTFFDKDKRSLT
ncbi:MAG: PilZ domain-containing protein [Spirochaetales bacterium]|nr:PilZ domain-containing protein [Spirochaetales bacterium]